MYMYICKIDSYNIYPYYTPISPNPYCFNIALFFASLRFAFVCKQFVCAQADNEAARSWCRADHCTRETIW